MVVRGVFVDITSQRLHLAVQVLLLPYRILPRCRVVSPLVVFPYSYKSHLIPHDAAADPFSEGLVIRHSTVMLQDHTHEWYFIHVMRCDLLLFIV